MIPVERLNVVVTRRMLGYGVLLVLAVLVPVGARTVFPPVLPPAPVPLPVPPLEWTTDGRTGPPSALAGLPAPGPNQKRAGTCTDGVEEEINGGCWLATDKEPPCPRARGGWVFFEHDGKCWVPVARAAPVPTTGGSVPVTLAE
jgi:hypothetical protein